MIDLPYLERVSAKWVDQPHALQYLPSDNLQRWLAKPYILSHALRKICGNLQLRLLSQAQEQVFADERFCLENPNETQAHVRKIILHDDSELYIFARTIIPFSTYQALLPQFEKLDTNFIGEYLLYNREDVQRDEFEFSYMTIHMPMRQELKQFLPVRHFDDILWARRSCFWIKQYPLLITELFLQEMPEYPE